MAVSAPQGLRHAPRVRGFALLVMLLLSVAAPAASGGSAPHNVLFVGNSFTYYNNGLQNHYRALLQSALPDVASKGRARILTISGAHLPEHRDGLRSMLAGGDWDVVVLQGHSRGPIGERTADAFRETTRDYAKLIRDQGAEPVLFMTWAYTGEPAMTKRLYDAYAAAGEELGARVVPVGLAFATVSTERPDIALRIADKKHPTLAGTYLAACVFFAVLHDQSPVGIDYTAGLDSATATYLQKTAWRTTQFGD